ncbi:unnamed protein product (macronuclear) [Paramecium tetraurelia]|uniref:EGF-like domain-containing protein n=1 Tax=Paramecium tetraurelia TaxID=5888 RepID=A0CSZ2_PARTE|nr:uncharacterized protein GSPATT00038927001 [Paramecium tetraurelia]CAK73909.1 unnamed protein product [Paramecium tetraurelia]|eukprot:XP_001441306.1 hypothetical protein (macronuclear) [Paramecium tetraurelia strain d4-2]
MFRKDIQFLILIIQLVDGFRRFENDFDATGFSVECPSGYYHAPGMHPHPCVSYSLICRQVTKLQMIVYSGVEKLCHPRAQLESPGSNLYLPKVKFCLNKTLIYNYSEDTDLKISCEIASNQCLIAQRSGDKLKCLYCPANYQGENCLPKVLNCGSNCGSCESNYCGTCKEGYSPDSSTDLYCRLACQPKHSSCSKENGVYSFQGCIKGYELVGSQCLACPLNCTQCVTGVCMECVFQYSLKDGQCFGDINCTRFDYNYDPNTGLAVGITCQQCDLTYFYNPNQQKCTLCKEQPDLKNCFICFNATECKVCYGTHVITADKKCTPFLGCSPNCQTCLYTDPDYCTTCNLGNKFKSSNIEPGKCVCDSPNGYVDKDGYCVKCTVGSCQTCGKDYYECTSCKTVTNRMVLDTQCVCKQGYYETGLEDQICQKCYEYCYNCKGPEIDDCTECGDQSIYHKYYENGQCFCEEGKQLILLSDGNSTCIFCHPLCQKCSKPVDDSTNQYCTMCIQGQHREVSYLSKCVCQAGYGSDGTIDICVKCHYSCTTCKGPLETDCTYCSNYAHRQMTIDNKCSCKSSYYDSGLQDIICKFSCHHSCSNCTVKGVDKCTSCPSTRYAIQAGTTFQCQCKYSNYYSDPLFLECQPCHPTCKTCKGILETNCLTCDTTYRELVISKCDCYPGFYNTGSIQCSQCHFTCLSCFSSDEDGCITCSSEKNRVMKANKCVCMNNTMQQSNTDSMCQKCSYRCSNCAVKPENCTTCPEYSERELGTDNSCQCPAYFYDQPDNPICIKCHSTCLTCQGSKSNQCTSCVPLSKRQLNSFGECKCPTSYFDIGLQECFICSSDCLECSITATNCTSCSPERYQLGNSCLCKTKLQGNYLTTYSAPLKINLFSVCHYSCLSCNGPQVNQCLSCLNSESRILISTSCICTENTFDINVPNCQKCDYRCEGCTTLRTQCNACPSSSLRIFNPLISSCDCPIQYYDDGVNTICQKCHYSCLTCKITSTRCNSCQANVYRTYNAFLQSCLCNDHYYDSGILICQQCHYSCLLCNASGDHQCISCQPQATSFRILNGKVCEMPPVDIMTMDLLQILHYFINLMHILCINKAIISKSMPIGLSNCSKCDSNCYNCNFNSKFCTACDSSILRILNTNDNTCYCQPGTTEIDGLCQYCDINCQTCSNSIINCISCRLSKLLIDSQCICIDGTYLSNVDDKCYPCNSTCETCDGLDTFCLSCSSDKNRILNNTNHTCICMDGYYEDTVNVSCLQCDKTCLTCFGNSSNCKQCDSSLNLTLNQQNLCICKSGYFFNLVAQQCQVCHYSCTECQTQTQCLTCELITRYLDSDTSQCICKDGFYEINQNSCLKCQSSCKTCQIKPSKCLTCNTSNFRYFLMNSCPCLDGFYDVGIEMCQKCSEFCKTCSISSTKCQSCFPNHLRAVNQNNCTCIPGYFDSGSLICEKCSNSCQTCKNQKDYCTSCDVNQNRLDQSIIHKCPCLSDFYLDSNEICQKCHVKCSGCVNERNNCQGCKYLQGSNRLTISNQCNCKDGYYDDDFQIICNKCDNRCKTCQKGAKNCLSCFSNVRINPPDCPCMKGYFETSQQVCEACEFQCDTCETMPSNCLTCKEGRINKLCDCEDGYFEGGQILCIQCDFQCQKCKKSSTNCLACKGDRLQIPFCRCQDGYYDDFYSFNCLKCDYTCKTCSSQGCLKCNGNRILSDQMTCDPPPNSISWLLTPWCSNCEVAVMKIKLSDDLATIIVLFDFPLNQNFFSTQLDINACFKLLNETTLSKLGINPTCNIDPDNQKQLLLNLGHNPTIIPGDKIDFLSGSLGHKNCNNKLLHFFLNIVENPTSPFAPIIKYDNIILMEQKLYLMVYEVLFSCHGLLLCRGKMEMAIFLISLLNQQISNNWIQQSQKKHYQSNLIQLQLQKFKTFFQRKHHIKYQFKHMQDNFPQYFPFESINLAFKLVKKSCIESSTLSNNNSQYQTKFYEVYRNNSKSRPSNINYTDFVNSNLLEFNIQSYSLSSWTAYTFQLTVSDSQIQYYQEQNVTIQIKSAGIFCQFNGTKKLLKYKDFTNIYIQCKDLDVQYYWNEDPDLLIKVSCLDLTSQKECKDSKQNNIQINSTQTTQFFPKATFLPFTIQAWIVIATKNSLSYSYKIIIVYLEDDFKILDIDYNNGYLIRPVNNYEDLQFTFNIPFQRRQYLLHYQIAIIYDYQLVAILKPQYHKYSFQLYDYYQQFSKGDKFLLKFVAQYSNDIIPNQADISLSLNQPPICKFRMLDYNIKALESHKIAINCEQSEDKPYLYQMKVFLFTDDFEEFQNKSSDNSLLFYSFQQSNNLGGYFPNAEIIIILQIIDQRGSITNIQQRLNISQNQIVCTNQTIAQLVFREKIAWIFEIMINHQDEQNCVKLKDELLKYVELGINSNDIYEQLLAHQTMNLYKKLILKQQASNTSKRYLEQNYQNICFNNKSSLFINTNQEHLKKNNTNISSLVIYSENVQKQITKLIKLKVNLEKQNEQHNIIADTKSIMLTKSVVQMLQISVHLIDHQFLIISQNEIYTENQEQVAKISEKLISLIDNITIHISESVQVNGKVLSIQGMILQFKLQKLTKSKLNVNFQTQNDQLDYLISFIQKQQLIVDYNYYNLSQTYRKMLKIYQINQILRLINIITSNQLQLIFFMLIPKLISKNQAVIIELTWQNFNIVILQSSFLQLLNMNINKFESCDLEILEINNQRAQLSCKCRSIGNLFLIKIAQRSGTQNSTILANQFQFDFSSIKLINQAFLFVQCGVILSSFFVYCFLLYKEYKSQKNIDLEQNQSERQDTLERDQNVLGRRFYPGHIFMFKATFKYIHSILQFFQAEERNVKKSFQFLQFSNLICILILISAWQVLVSTFIIINAQINLIILLGVRTISKIFEGIYQLGGKTAIAVVLLYLCLPAMYLILTIFILNQIESNKSDIDVQIFLNLLSSLFLVFFIFEPISIYVRIVLYRPFYNSVKRNDYIPINHFIYFFLYHGRINKIYDQLNVR